MNKGIPELLEILSNLIGVLTDIPTLLALFGGLAVIQGCAEFIYIKMAIAFFQFFILYMIVHLYNRKIAFYKQEICELQKKSVSHAEEIASYEQEICELQKQSVSNCLLNKSVIETYLKCEDKSFPVDSISFADLVQLKSNFLTCSKEFHKKAYSISECMNKLLLKDADHLVHVDFCSEDEALAKEIIDLLHCRGFFTISSFLEGLDGLDYYGSKDIKSSCRWAVVIYHLANDEKTVRNRLNKLKSYRREHGTRILICSSKMIYQAKTQKWVDHKDDLINPEHYRSIVDRLEEKKESTS